MKSFEDLETEGLTSHLWFCWLQEKKKVQICSQLSFSLGQGNAKDTAADMLLAEQPFSSLLTGLPALGRSTAALCPGW